MNIDDIPTTLVSGTASPGQYGLFKLEIRVNIDPGHELTDAERFACYDAEKLLKYAFMKARMDRDPKAKEAAAEERAALLGCFPETIFVETIPNGYCSDWCCTHLPWFVVTTRKGRITIGWRKRVINISWDKCVAGEALVLFPNEDVTRTERTIHAWSLEKAQEYIAVLLRDPERVRLTQDFQDPKVQDVHYEAGTVLLRSAGGQYVPEGARLGAPCVTGFFLIRDICEVMPDV